MHWHVQVPWSYGVITNGHGCLTLLQFILTVWVVPYQFKRNYSISNNQNRISPERSESKTHLVDTGTVAEGLGVTDVIHQTGHVTCSIWGLEFSICVHLVQLGRQDVLWHLHLSGSHSGWCFTKYTYDQVLLLLVNVDSVDGIVAKGTCITRLSLERKPKIPRDESRGTKQAADMTSLQITILLQIEL